VGAPLKSKPQNKPNIQKVLTPTHRGTCKAMTGAWNRRAGGPSGKNERANGGGKKTGGNYQNGRCPNHKTKKAAHTEQKKKKKQQARGEREDSCTREVKAEIISGPAIKKKQRR